MGVDKKRKKDKEMHDFRITPFHVDDEVTGSSVLIEIDGLKILCDLGMYQNQSRNLETIYKINEQKLAIPFREIDYVVFSSAHADHCAGGGLLGRLDLGFNGTCICTELSQELIKLNLDDSAFLMLNECEAYNKKHNKQIEPLFNKYDVERVLGLLRGYGYDEKIYLNKSVYIQFLPNGHLSGDGSILITYEKDEYTKKSILYTGDHNYGKKSSKPFTKVWNSSYIKPCCVITEATYAGETQVKGNPIDELERYIMEEVIQKRKILFIPSFAIHRSTELAYMLKVIWDRNKIIRNADVPIYMCGVMMAKAHRIIGNPKHKEFYDEQWQEQDELFNWDKLRFIESFKDVQGKVVNQNAKIIISSSGMLTGGYAKYLLSCYVTQKNCSILFTGYQGLDTTGRKLYEQEHKSITIDGKAHTIRATILGKLEGLSGHAEDRGLRGLIKSLNLHNLKKVIIIHGEDGKKQVLKEELELDLPDKVEIIIPKSKSVIKI
jgi:metallo-beta-lactamase family protein